MGSQSHVVRDICVKRWRAPTPVGNQSYVVRAINASVGVQWRDISSSVAELIGISGSFIQQKKLRVRANFCSIAEFDNPERFALR